MTHTTHGATDDGPGIDALDVAHAFPALAQRVRGHRLVYLDSASTSQTPQVVIDAINTAYIELRANVHRGVHTLSARATDAYETARDRVAQLVGAESPRDIVFVSGATAAINLVAHAWGDANVGAGDEIVVTTMEHHSNLVPWQQLCERTGATLRAAPLDERGAVDMSAYGKLLGSRTKLVALAHVSNALGTVNPVRAMVAMAHDVGAVAVVDGAQAAPHLRVDVREFGCEFYALSGHKMYGPTGIGALYGAPDVLAAMPPHHAGGGAIERVTLQRTRFAGVPQRFEPGTPNIVGAVGLAAALDFIHKIGTQAIEAHERALLRYATAAIDDIDQCRRIGTAAPAAAVCSFVVRGVHPHDVATILDERGVAVQAGHHCAQPVMEHFGVPATVRMSLGVHNTRTDIDVLIAGIRAAVEVMAR